VTLRSTAAYAVAVLSATALLAAPAAAQAAGVARAGTVAPAATVLTGTPTVKSLGLTGQVSDMVLAGGKIWVSTGGVVDVFSTAGAKLRTITGLPGAGVLLASADGDQVYVALGQDARVVSLDATSMAQTASWTTSPCPADLALAAGRLFYSYGCAGAAGAISSLSVTDGSPGPVAGDAFSAVPALAGAANTLIAGDQSGSPTAITSYLANADGTLTSQATTTTAAAYDLALSPDGTKMVVTGYDSDYSLERFNTADLSAAGTSAMSAYPDAVAYSPDGKTFAGSLASSPTGMFRVFGSGSGALTSQSSINKAGTTNPDVLPGTLQYSADSSRLYGIAEVGGVAQLLTASARPIASSTLTATVTSPKAYGKKTAVKISTAGRPHTKVSVAVPALSGTKTYNVTTNASGSALIHPLAPVSGLVTVTIPGDLRHAAKRITKSVKVPAKLTATPTGYYSTSGGMRHYHSVAKVYIATSALPKRQMTLGVHLQARVNSKWVTVASGNFATNPDGLGAIVLTSANKNRPYRLVLSFAGDSFNTKAPTVTSKTFIID
jgi:hypothetical protein